jgi:hypothetical protein
LLKNMLSDHPGYVLLFFLIVWLLCIYLLKTYSGIASKSHLPTSDE